MAEFSEITGKYHKTTSVSEISEKEKREQALFTLKAIAQGLGSNPRVYAQNTLDRIGVKY
jgi:hypothetical protein